VRLALVVVQISNQMFSGIFLATFAGLSTTLGAIAIFFIKEKSRVIGLSLGFSAGVMIGISIFELIPEAIENIGLMNTGFTMIIGMIFLSILDFFIAGVIDGAALVAPLLFEKAGAVMGDFINGRKIRRS